MSYITEAFKELKDIDKDELQKELNTQGVTEDKYIAEEYISEGEAKTDRKLKTEVIQWMNKYNNFYNFWRGPEFSDTLRTSLGVTIFPESYEKAKIAEEALTGYLNDLGYSTWGSGAKRTEPGVVNLHVSYDNGNRPKSKAYTYSYGYKYEDLDEGIFGDYAENGYEADPKWLSQKEKDFKETSSLINKLKDKKAIYDINKELDSLLKENLEEGLIDKIKELLGHEPTTSEDWQKCLDDGYISWDELKKAEEKAEKRRQKEYKNSNSNMCYTDWKNFNSKGL